MGGAGGAGTHAIATGTRYNRRNETAVEPPGCPPVAGIAGHCLARDALQSLDTLQKRGSPLPPDGHAFPSAAGRASGSSPVGDPLPTPGRRRQGMLCGLLDGSAVVPAIASALTPPLRAFGVWVSAAGVFSAFEFFGVSGTKPAEERALGAIGDPACSGGVRGGSFLEVPQGIAAEVLVRYGFFVGDGGVGGEQSFERPGLWCECSEDYGREGDQD